MASLLKLYLRDLPEPVVPWSQYEGFLLCGQLMNADEAKVCISLELVVLLQKKVMMTERYSGGQASGSGDPYLWERYFVKLELGQQQKAIEANHSDSLAGT